MTGSPAQTGLAALMLISIDIETKDPLLKSKGVGCRRPDGYITAVGIGILYHDGTIVTETYNLRHHEATQVTEQEVTHRLQAIARSSAVITGANLIYDLDWIEEKFGVHFPNRLEDVQVAEPLINENRESYSLDSLAQIYGFEGKSDEKIRQYCKIAFKSKEYGADIWRCPWFLVKEYLEADLRMPLLIHQAQMEEIDRQGLGDIWDIECRLQPLLLAMKRKGVRVDLERTNAMIVEFGNKFDRVMGRLKQIRGEFVEVWSAASIARLFDHLGLKYRFTPTGKPSFTKAFLEGHRHPAAKLILQARQYDKMRSTFLENAILGMEVNGRIHCQFNQLRGDQYGTVTGRMSSSKPNLQQIPARSDIGKLIRTLFIPEQGEQWCKLDYSQIEPRLLLSYAKGKSAEKIIQQYAENPSLDCYKQMMKGMPSWLERPAVKQIYLGATYGMGQDLMALNMGVAVEDAVPQFEAFHEGAPYIKGFSNRCANIVEQHGQIRTLGGRVRRFDLWEPRKFKRGAKGLPLELAKAEYGDKLRRAYAYKAINCVIQGGAADIMKRAMVEAYERGYDTPLLTVHDELDFSYVDPENMFAIADVMTQAYSDLLKVPMMVDVESGPDWGSVRLLRRPESRVAGF